MSANIDLKDLWNREQTALPDVKEIFAKGAKLQHRTRKKIIFSTILPLTLTILFVSMVWMYHQPKMITTKLGLLLIIGAIVFFIMASVGYLNLLYKNNTDSNTNDFLLHFIKIKQKQESMGTTMLSIYFALLTTGIVLYMIEYVKRGGPVFQVAAYGITFAWIAFNWFYIIPRAVKRQRDKMNAIIDKLEEINGQLAEE